MKKKCNAASCRHHGFCRSLGSNSNDSDQEYEGIGQDEDANSDIGDVLSGEEVVLACRTYLQRKHRFENGWTEQQRRKELEKQVSATRKDSSFSGSIGYFWENIAELKQFHDRNDEDTLNSSDSLSSSSPSAEEQDNDNDLSNNNNVVQIARMDNSGDLSQGADDTTTKYLYYDGNSNDDMLLEHDEQYGTGDGDAIITSDSVIMGEGEFTGFPVFPSQERLNRSNAAKKKWNDPEWKAMWYERRWGSSARHRQKQRQQQNGEGNDNYYSTSNNDRKTKDYMNPNHYSYRGGSFFPSPSSTNGLKDPPPTSKEEKKKQKILEDKIRSVPPELLESPMLASMTEEEISSAIESYISANRKRRQKKIQNPYGRGIITTGDNDATTMNSNDDNDDGTPLPTTLALLRTQKQQLQQQQQKQNKKQIGKENTPQAKRIPRDALLTESPDVMKKAQQKRSERAKKAYQTRLLNQEQRRRKNGFAQTEQESDNHLEQQEHPQPPRRRIVPSAQTPRDALIRIKAALDDNNLPSVDDIQLILQPMKLHLRKEIFRRILLEHFNLRGKCVPKSLLRNDDEKEDDSGDDKIFITDCTIEQLGAFVLYKMNEKATDSTRVV